MEGYPIRWRAQARVGADSKGGESTRYGLADASIQYLGFRHVLWVHTDLPSGCLYEAWRFVNGIIILAGRVQMVVLGRPVRPGHTLKNS